MQSDVLALASPHGRLQIYCTVVSPEKLARPGVQHLRYDVIGHGFGGAGAGFYDEKHLREFCSKLFALVRGQVCSAQLLADPACGGLTLEICPGVDADSLSIVGSIAARQFRTLNEADGFYEWRTDFGFSIRRANLAKLSEVTWVVAHAV